MKTHKATKIFVVCMGNICRSPTGEAVLRQKAADRGIDVIIDSAGTIGYHEGAKPDSRSRAAGEARGYDFSGIYSRPVVSDDFEHFDMILAADKANLADLLDNCPKQYRHKVSLFLSHGDVTLEEIPDPYFGRGQGFEQVLDLIEEASDSILDKCQ
ncbi:low molecular weight protein-tyrosine-phosphatase [Enterovibrio nigricans]|uniref:Protein-tyrosine phosphatase n=1 Tax=Enterovibrio nigricans DSM 22720 TaxID=1121868 RepID=A0A1T4U5N5_9GAMM|nr:low molecular weight protein-tyrosine-phosphatase [Enterovibrio nigricans]PKF51337.1 low molecular weight phosphotyrosine protein phosphatase [Enterovibrio nigricans]SKA48004.1 protein-tyrosine phosphatase [Enterovibrio nigricans DSM 22720]